MHLEKARALSAPLAAGDSAGVEDPPQAARSKTAAIAHSAADAAGRGRRDMVAPPGSMADAAVAPLTGSDPVAAQQASRPPNLRVALEKWRSLMNRGGADRSSRPVESLLGRSGQQSFDELVDGGYG
jgi:hypothetical protein